MLAPVMDATEIVQDFETRAAALRLSINEVCKRAGIARSTFSRCKAGSHLWTLGTLQKIETAISEAEKKAA